ncbi:hypothetical protein D3C86_1882480 [compost metagenome]
MPDQLDLDLRLVGAQLNQRALQLALADQAPGADEVEEHLDMQTAAHGCTSSTASVAESSTPLSFRRAMSSR